MRHLRLLLAFITSFAAVLALVLTPTPANADTQTFRDLRDDVPTANDIRWLRVNYDFDLNVTYKLKGIPRGEIALYVDVGGTSRPDYIWYGQLGGPEDYAFYRARGWFPGEEIDCDLDYFKNRENRSVRLEISGDCFDEEYDELRVAGATSYWQRRTDTYINIDWAPRRRAWYPPIENG